MQTEKKEWKHVVAFFQEHFAKSPDLNAVLFIVGVRELGFLGEKKFTKEQKVDLMHIATCKVLSLSGYYDFEGEDEHGWPIWKNVKPLPPMNLLDQEHFLQQHVIAYFDLEGLI